MHDQVVEVDKSSDICTQDEYYDHVQTKYTDVLEKESGIKFGEISISEDSEKIAITSNEAIHLFSLPRIELQIFSGGALSYHTFIRSFKVNVDKLCADFDSRLELLLQYTSGEAKDVFKSSVFIRGKIGYEQALNMRESLYGSKHRVTQDIIKSLRADKLVKTPDDMRALCNELRNTYQVLDNIDALCELDTQICIFSIVARLPAWVQNRWDKN